jgi:hypothetical protein
LVLAGTKPSTLVLTVAELVSETYKSKSGLPFVALASIENGKGPPASGDSGLASALSSDWKRQTQMKTVRPVAIVAASFNRS